MKSIGANLLAHMAGELTTLATLWKITRTDGAVFGFTDHDANIAYDGVAYEASSGYTASAIRTSADLAVDNMEAEGMLSSETIADADLIAGLWDHAAFIIMRVNYADLTMGHEIMRAGTIGNVSTGRQHFTAELRGMMQPLQQSVGRVYTPACDAALGDARCGIALGSYTVTGSVTTATSGRVFTDTARTETDDYFAGGLITWTSGDNDTYQMEVKSSTSAGVITLQQTMPNGTTIGDTYSLSAGCDKLLATCRDKFNNVVNFRGFPHVPGPDKVIAGR